MYYQQGPSDKVYHAHLEAKGDGWIVNFAFGRRGSTLQTGTKTSEPVAYDKAKTIYDKIVAEKMGKGYTPAAGGTPYAGTENAGKVSGLLPQLLNMIDDAELELLLNDLIHCGQEKFDGRHTMVRKNDAVVGANKKGLLMALPLPIQKALEDFIGTFVVDGEAIGDRLYVFDLLEIDGKNLRSKPYKERYLESEEPDRPIPGKRGRHHPGRNSLDSEGEAPDVREAEEAETGRDGLQAGERPSHGWPSEQRWRPTEIQVLRHGVGRRHQGQSQTERGRQRL